MEPLSPDSSETSSSWHASCEVGGQATTETAPSNSYHDELTMPNPSKKNATTTSTQAYGDAGATCFFDQVNTPGCYVGNQTGVLFRIPPDGLAPGMSPAIEAVSNEHWQVTKISGDPYLTTTKARMIAADFDLEVNF